MVEPVPSLAELRPDLAFVPELDAVIQRAMAKDPKDRFADAEQMLAALESAAASPPVAAHHPSPAVLEPPRAPMPAASAAPGKNLALRAAMIVVVLLTATAIGWALVAFFSGRPG